jgi:putative hydrolase of the HAD superfamily
VNRAIKGILFDLDATLFDREACVREVVAAQHEAFQRELAGIDAGVYSARALALDAHGYRDKDTVYRQMAEEFALPEALAARLLADFWERYDVAGQLFDDVLPALNALRAADLKLGIITNGATARQQRKIDRLGLREFFHAVLISEREGVRKPERALFERAWRRLDLRAEDVCHVGDHPEADIRGAVDGASRPSGDTQTIGPRRARPIASSVAWTSCSRFYERTRYGSPTTSRTFRSRSSCHPRTDAEPAQSRPTRTAHAWPPCPLDNSSIDSVGVEAARYNACPFPSVALKLIEFASHAAGSRVERSQLHPFANMLMLSVCALIGGAIIVEHRIMLCRAPH